MGGPGAGPITRGTPAAPPLPPPPGGERSMAAEAWGGVLPPPLSQRMTTVSRSVAKQNRTLALIYGVLAPLHNGVLWPVIAFHVGMSKQTYVPPP